MQKAINVKSDPAASTEVQSAFFDFAKQQIDQHIQAFPGDARIHVFYGSFLRLNGRYDDSIKNLEKAHELSPGKQTILIELALSYLAKGDIERAVAAAKKAHEMDPTYDVPRVMYTAILMYAGNQKEADRVLIERFNTAIVDNEILLQAYVDTKQFAKVLEIWKARAKSSPNDANAFIGLGRAYLMTGDKANAIASVKEAIRIEPQFKEQGESIIKDITAGKQ
jgi:tetratricopeptide (TPR) repeat protein